MSNCAVWACRIMGAIFILVAIWGFIDGSRVLIFHVNTMHNIVHLVSGIAALACSWIGLRASIAFCLIFGVVYLLVGILGFLGVPFVIDLLHLNQADNWLHIVIAAVFIGAGIASLRPHAVKRTPRTAMPQM